MHEHGELVIKILIAENRVLGEKSQCHFFPPQIARAVTKKKYQEDNIKIGHR